MNYAGNESEKRVLVNAWWIETEVQADDLVRMTWEVKNHTDDVIIIDGYQIKILKQSELRPLSDEKPILDSDKENQEVYSSSSHVVTILWPEESRTYVWATVPTGFYKLTRGGKSGYYVKIRYRKGDSDISYYEASDIAIIHIKRGPKPMALLTFLQQSKKELSELLHDEFEFKLKYRISHIGIIDILLIGDNSVVVIEVTGRVLNSTVNQMHRYLEWVKVAFAKRKTIGMIIASDHESAYQWKEKRLVMPPETELYVGSIKDGRFNFTIAP